MATDKSFVDFVCEQLREIFKKTVAGEALLPRVIEGEPFPGAKSFFLVDDVLDDTDLLIRLVEATFNELPMPKVKKPKAKK
jgi:hypothetical protein